MNTTNIKKTAIAVRTKLIEAITDKINYLKVDQPNELPVIGNKQDSRFREGVLKIQRTKLIERYEELGKNKKQLAEEVAYIWFNRLIALRFMEVNGYLPNKELVLSSSDSSRKLPDSIVYAANLKLATIDQKKVQELVLSNKTEDIFKYILIGYCSHLHKQLPFLFDEIDSYTELLLPDNLLLSDSVVSMLVHNIPMEDWKEVEIIGWLYQYYISEKKDAVMKSKQKVKPEDIPARTQLFTPNWIVRYMVQNSLGRLWMLNNPDSKLVKKMEYYIIPETESSDYLKIGSPEEIKICDPAVGSGHILVYAFELLFEIYKESGYSLSEIPNLIITKNLYGIEIDKRAGQLAGFALLMKAREYDKKFLSNLSEPNICVLENVVFEKEELSEYIKAVGTDLFTANLHTTLKQFSESDNFGSLIQPAATNIEEIKATLKEKNIGNNLFLNKTHENVLKVLHMADYLSPKYHVVVANPPYMGKEMNARLKSWLKDNYPDSKKDLFAAFIERNTSLALPKGQLGFMSPFVWMFISSYEKLRKFLIDKKTITSLIQLEYSGFDGATVPICTFTVENDHHPELKGGFIRLSDFRGATNQAPKTLEAIKNIDCGWFYRSSGSDFKKIPGNPIVYWASERILDHFQNRVSLSQKIETREGLTTGSNDLFLRLWHEVQLNKIGFGTEDNNEAQKSQKRYFTYIKGGDFRRWYGNFEYIVNWFNDGKELRAFKDITTGRVRSHNYNGDYAFRTGFAWSGISSGTFSVRHVPHGFMFDAKGPMGFAREPSEQPLHEAFLNSSVTNHLIKMLAPTLDFKLGHILNLPVVREVSKDICQISKSAVQLSACDWDSYETSWNFTTLPILNSEYYSPSLKDSYDNLRSHWQYMTNEMKQLEEENNKIFIDAYELQDELTPDVPLSEITLTCNPHYRYKGKKTDVQLEKLLLESTIKEYISYAVGCMMGRYSIDKEGLILANQGDTLKEYLSQVQNPTFMPDDDGIIPITDIDDFNDDIVNRFTNFVSITLGKQYLDENLLFIASVLGKKSNQTPRQTIRQYFIKDFFKDHTKMYKKRPIYWLLKSGKEKAFGALIYMHRYTPSLFAKVRTQYLHKLQRIIDNSIERENELTKTANGTDKIQAQNQLSELIKKQTELHQYDELLHIHADNRKEIDLDDGVAINYLYFQDILEKI